MQIKSLNLLIWAIVLRGGVQATPIPGSDVLSAISYLSKYGWIEEPSITSASVSSRLPSKLISMEDSIKEFQAFVGLNVTGELDNETLQTMSLPRCGVRDKTRNNSGRRKRYVLAGSSWPAKEITFRITRYPEFENGLDGKTIDREIQAAFQMWERYADLVFKKIEFGIPDIEIRFGRKDHVKGCVPFDGRGNTLAHAYYPVDGGDVHFDEDEVWTINSHGTNLFQLAVHEFGHSLGLNHSSFKGSVMQPHYKYNPKFKEGLSSDDVEGVQSMYGRSVNRKMCDEEQNEENEIESGNLRSCEDVQKTGVNISGIYYVYPGGSEFGTEVYCDFETDGGGWTIIQRRVTTLSCEEIDFDKYWNEYEEGFGRLDDNHFLGLHNIFQFTKRGNMELRIDLQDWEGDERFALYKNFKLGCPKDSYRLKVSGYSGNAGDSFSYHNDMAFTTKDKDNDRASGNCAISWSGGWWYDNCYQSHLTGKYNISSPKGITWKAWHGNEYSLRKVEMKIRERRA